MKRFLAQCLSLALIAALLCMAPLASAQEGFEIPVEYGISLDNVNVDGVLNGQYAGQTLIVVSETGDMDAALRDQISYFEELSGATVELRTYPWEELTSKIMLGFNGDEEMDVVAMVTSFMKGYDDLGYLKDLNAVAETYAAPSYDIGDFLSGLIDGGSDAEGHLFAIPYQPTIFMFYYLADLFEDADIQAAFKEKTGNDLKVPETMEELQVTAEFFTKAFNEDSPTTYGWAAYGAIAQSRWSWEHWLGALGGNLVDENMLPAFTDGTGAEAMAFAMEMMQYASPETMQIGYDELGLLFGSGDVAMAVGWPGVVNQIEGTAVADRAGFGVVPGGAPVASGWSIGINNATEKEELAWRFIEFCTSKDGEVLKIKNRMHPTRTSNYEREGIGTLTDMYPALLASLKTSGVMADVPVPYIGLQLNDILEMWTQSAYNGTVPIDEAIDNMAKEMTEAMRTVGLVE